MVKMTIRQLPCSSVAQAMQASTKDDAVSVRRMRFPRPVICTPAARAASASAYLCGIEGEAVTEGLAAFCGANRRMEYKGIFCGADVYDDYGHHPTEVSKTLEGVAEMGYERVICVFQPHTYSRTSGLFREFTEAFDRADIAVIADIYAAREPDTGIVSSMGLAAAIGNGRYEGDFKGILRYLERELRDGDVLIVMGAGDIYKLFEAMNL